MSRSSSLLPLGSVLHKLHVAIAAIGTCLLHANASRADQYVVQAGLEWSSLAARLKPGDEVVLARGTHVPATFTGLAGSSFAPITIRSWAPDQLAEIAADREAIKLVDCSHIRIERIAARGARRAGLLIESTKPGASIDVSVKDVLVAGAKGLAEEAGIIARGVHELGIRRSRIENSIGCGILIEDCENVTLSDIQIAARTDITPACGVRLAGRVWSALIERVQMGGAILVAFDIGRSESTLHARPSANTPKTAPPTPTREADPTKPDPGADQPGSTAVKADPLVRFLVISNSRIAGAHSLFYVGSVADSSIRNVTHREAKEEVYRIFDPPAGRPPVQMRMSECLLTWMPGALRRLGSTDGGADASGLILGPNLWWSSELPAALDLLGPADQRFPGTLAAEQILNIKPNFAIGSRVINEEAAGFGAASD